MLRHRSILFLLSDFQVPPDEDRFHRTLKLVSNRHDLVAVRMVDAAEEALPDAGLLVLQDPETGEEVVLDTRRTDVRRSTTPVRRPRSGRSHPVPAARRRRDRGADRPVLRPSAPGLLPRRERKLAR
jgi:hypothetical protein